MDVVKEAQASENKRQERLKMAKNDRGRKYLERRFREERQNDADRIQRMSRITNSLSRHMQKR